jgi:phosphoglycolate phosphatase-like HAD superfamily hydrolase
VLVCQDDHLKAKPAPDGILYAMEQLGCTESIYAGDSVSDLLAGRNAGSTVIAALTKIEKEQGLIDFGPDHAVYDLDEIRQILQEKYEH